MTNRDVNWYAQAYTKRFGWDLVPLPPMQKFPTADNWGENTITKPEQANEFYTSNADWGVGLVLGKSNMCSLDIDCEESFQALLAEFGLPAEDLEKYPTIQGRGRRITFRVPDGVVLPYCKLNWPSEGDPKKKYTVVELRASGDGKQRQDVLPPTIHPGTGKPYTWLVQPPKTGDWPTPPDWLLSIWGAWDCFKPQFVDACPWGPKPEITAPVRERTTQSSDSGGAEVVAAFMAANSITSTLSNYGYKRMGRRWLSPHSGTGIAGVHLLPDGERCYIFHASDPLCSEDRNGQPVNSFDLYCEYEHGGDMKAAIKAAAKDMGMEHKRIKAPTPMPQVEHASEPVQGAVDEKVEPAGPAAPVASASDNEFLCLGYNGKHIFVLPRRSEQVTRLSYGGLTKSALLQIASLEWWAYKFPKKEGVDWELAMNAILRWCENKGIYDERKERGRGAWFDDGKPVLHLGTRLMVESQQIAIHQHESKYIYTKQAPIENAFNASPASDEQAAKVLKLFKQVNWLKPEHSLLTVGWCVLAPICGALNWRPHLWLTAQRGVGKSWFQSNLAKPLIGEETLIYCQGGTTEAGIRQALKHDARPVMFDEAESEDITAARRMQSVLELARQSSSDTGAEIVKGTANGDGMAFTVRSMFLLGSINVGLKQAADESRFSVVQLVKPDKTPEEAQRFAQFERDVIATMTRETCQAIRARAYNAIPIIRHNAKVMAQAVAEAIGSQRMGDQVGTLLAGAFIMQEVKQYTLEQARELVSGFNFDDATESEEVSDEHNCLNAILQRQVRVEYAGFSSANKTIGELVEAIYSQPNDTREEWDTLSRHGVRVDGEWVMIANTHSELYKTLKDTAWGNGHRRMLMRIEGAVAGEKAARFAGSASRYVSIPINEVI